MVIFHGYVSHNQMVYVGVWNNHDHWCYIMELYPQKYDHGVK